MNSQSIALSAIASPPSNPRRHFDDVELAGLVKSVKAHGVLEPIIVRPTYRLDGDKRGASLIDPERYFASVGRPADPLGMREALRRIERLGISLGNFTHTH